MQQGGGAWKLSAMALPVLDTLSPYSLDEKHSWGFGQVVLTNDTCTVEKVVFICSR